jgi:1-aminocyclopropane-1-carboxylate deaminase/D-cysteine desulfhydrase-like pyridoxal-dependent ACC family enzyme
MLVRPPIGPPYRPVKFWETLTPVDYAHKILLKRDDLFKMGEVNGGKLRQAFILIKKNLELIKTQHEGVVVCPCSNKSPQSAIMTIVCKYFGLKCKVVTYKTLKPNLPLALAQANRAELYSCSAGWNSVIEARAKTLKGFNIKMGFGSEDIIDVNVGQVLNIPEELEYLIVPVGSAYNFISVLNGLEKYNKKVKKIIGVYVGKEPFKTLEENYKGKLTYELVKSPFSYSTSCLAYPFLDEIYEAKAYKWAMDNLTFNKEEKSLFWVVGKRDYSFDYKEIELKWQDI